MSRCLALLLVIAPPLPQEGALAAPVLIWGDYDHDGLEDVYVLDSIGEGRLLRNNGDGSFEDRTVLAGLSGDLASRSAAWGDYDRDGWPDLYVSSSLGGGKLLRNQQDGSFVDVTEDAGLACASDVHDAIWLDYDGDEYLDLALEGTAGSRLLHNKKDATFESMLVTSGQGLRDLVAPRIAGTVLVNATATDPESDQRKSEPAGFVPNESGRISGGGIPVLEGTAATSVRAVSRVPGSVNLGPTNTSPTPPPEGFVPSGAILLGESEPAPAGYTSTGLYLEVPGVPANGVWALKANMPSASMELAGAAVGGSVYAIGGIGISGSALATVQQYDTQSDSWTTKASMPTARWGLAAVTVNGKIYAIGGAVNSALATVEEYDPRRNTWVSRTPMITARSWLAAAEVNGKIYAIGGYRFPSRLATVEEYDPVTTAWVTKASMPTARSQLAAASIGGKIYAIGGFNGSNDLATVEEYDPVSNTWTTKAPMPTARHGLAAAAPNGRIYAIGGYPTGGFFGPNAEYDPKLNAWILRAPLTTGRFALAAVATYGKIYTLGGWAGTGNPVLANVEQYEPSIHRFYFHQKN